MRPVSGQHHVGRLHVAVDDCGREPVQIGQHVAQLTRDVDHEPFGQRPAANRDFFFQVAPFDVLHHQVMAVLVVETVADPGNRRMLQLREGVGLAGEIFVGLNPLLRVDEMVDHFLDGAQGRLERR